MALSRWKKALYSFGVLFAVLGAAEGVLRLTFPVARRVSMPNDMINAHLQGEAFRYDPDLGWYWKHLSIYGAATNAYGFRRTKPMSLAKPEGGVRVVTFGDSQTFGAGVPVDESYSAMAEEVLGSGWEVLNAGISGYRSLNVYRLLRLRIGAFDPDAIVVDCMPFDSPRDTSVGLAGKPLVESWTDTVKRWAWRSRLYYLTRLGLEKLDPDRPRWLDQAMSTNHGPSRDAGNHDLILEWGRQNGVEVFFMEYPVMDERGKLGCMTGEGELPPGANVIRACAAILGAGKSGWELFQDRNHLTAEGNRVVGHVVAEALREWREGKGTVDAAP